MEHCLRAGSLCPQAGEAAQWRTVASLADTKRSRAFLPQLSVEESLIHLKQSYTIILITRIKFRGLSFRKDLSEDLTNTLLTEYVSKFSGC